MERRTADLEPEILDLHLHLEESATVPGEGLSSSYLSTMGKVQSTLSQGKVCLFIIEHGGQKKYFRVGDRCQYSTDCKDDMDCNGPKVQVQS